MSYPQSSNFLFERENIFIILHQHKCSHGSFDGEFLMFKALYDRHVNLVERYHLWGVKLSEPHTCVKQWLNILPAREENKKIFMFYVDIYFTILLF